MPRWSPPEETTLTLSAVEAADLEDDLAKYLDELPPGVGLLVLPAGHGRRQLVPARGRRRTTAGRHPDSDIFLDDITVSRRHAVIERRRRTASRFATPARSTAPTSTASASTRPTLRTGDELQIGRFRLSFVLGRGEGLVIA